MDLSTIIDHLDNFVTTWEGWGKVFEGLNAFDGFKNLFEVTSYVGEGTLQDFSSLSSEADA
ncbi:hypothetical protein ACTXN7_02630 [Corynebacterium flavescens]|uniref:Uncharacterized protein n=1 Tax=Corynebacterium flavescens TaxID=28028 RepID=A0A1L7CP92_CORFL|nr:hypothetical protein [Corynebacterium flavescens]APT87660.1 hypothetical protein CFLV_11190 [Corynebacterium flavescens]KAA8720048.1 hypothetical protein F4V60_10815 [Corynebacterium flavescens]MDN6198295.1 hypothetical protein [Corynebacterium flavescens]MDN6225414.1 hypothetical protein [Corynebacterium flavescens]GEB96951.1 hypothetical protein CFL01nite_04460 [Corynebacterium flavescens]